MRLEIWDEETEWASTFIPNGNRDELSLMNEWVGLRQSWDNPWEKTRSFWNSCLYLLSGTYGLVAVLNATLTAERLKANLNDSLGDSISGNSSSVKELETTTSHRWVLRSVIMRLYWLHIFNPNLMHQQRKANFCMLAWWELLDFIVAQPKINRFLHSNETGSPWRAL